MKVFPDNAPTTLSATPVIDVKAIGDSDAVVEELTVWRKSLLFGCEGFTVYDRKGNLVHRVDDYGCGGVGWKGEIVLMDSGGVPLLTIRRKTSSSGA
ncbi:LURP-one-related 8-like protein [Drosera capensis]